MAAEAFAPMRDRLSAACTIWKANRSEGDSLYVLDPDGHKPEVHVGSLEARLRHLRATGVIAQAEDS